MNLVRDIRALRHSPPKLMRFSVRDATADIDLFSDSTSLYSDRTICIYLNDVVGSLGRTIQFTMDISISDKHLVPYMVVMVYPEAVFSGIIFVHIFLFPESNHFPVCNEFDIEEHVPVENQLGWRGLECTVMSTTDGPCY